MPTLVTLCGSLRRSSWNQQVLDLGAALLPEGWEARHLPLGAVPLYDQDLEDDGGSPIVDALRAQVEAADAVLSATPQYNLGISGVLKNALDWLSRPLLAGALLGKPAAAIAVSPSRHAPVEALSQAELTLEVCAAQLVRPGVAIASIGHRVVDGRFDDEVEGSLADLVGRLLAVVSPETAAPRAGAGAPHGSVRAESGDA